MTRWKVGDGVCFDTGTQSLQMTVRAIIPIAFEELDQFKRSYPGIEPGEVMVEARCEKGQVYRFVGCDRNFVRVLRRGQVPKGSGEA